MGKREAHLHLAYAFIHLRVGGQRTDLRGGQLQHSPLTCPGSFLLSDDAQLLFGKGLLLADLQQDLVASDFALENGRHMATTNLLQSLVWHRHLERDS